jgi:hypothetical protein
MEIHYINNITAGGCLPAKPVCSVIFCSIHSHIVNRVLNMKFLFIKIELRNLLKIFQLLNIIVGI